MQRSRREQIIEAARVLVARHGYRRNSMEDIAAEAGLAKRTLYLHFDSKEAIFRAMLDACQHQIRTRASDAERLDGSLGDRIADLLYAYLGTPLEWFGNGIHLREIQNLVGDDPVTFGSRTMCDELTARVTQLMTRASAAERRPGCAERIQARGRIAVLATLGVTSQPDADATTVRRGVHEIAGPLCEDLEHVPPRRSQT